MNSKGGIALAIVNEANTVFLRGDVKRAAQMYLEGAKDGDPDCAFNYAYCLYRGVGVERDAAEAKSYFVFAGELEGEAYYDLAMLYMHGDGVPRNYKKSFNYMLMAGEAGCIEAQLYLGMAYTTGAILEPDVTFITRIPFHKPEYRNDDLLLAGEVADFEKDEDERSFTVSADAKEAYLWFRAAAYHDPTYVSELVAKGKYLYAKCYLDGLGTDFDRQKAARLMLAAGKSGSREAVEFLASCGVPPERYLGKQ